MYDASRFCCVKGCFFHNTAYIMLLLLGIGGNPNLTKKSQYGALQKALPRVLLKS